jgi:hypothetical protein
MKKKKRRRLDDRWRRETAYHLSMISAALNARAAWDHANAKVWYGCTDLLATASGALRRRRKLPREWQPLFRHLMVQLRSNRADD